MAECGKTITFGGRFFVCVLEIPHKHHRFEMTDGDCELLRKHVFSMDYIERLFEHTIDAVEVLKSTAGELIEVEK